MTPKSERGGPDPGGPPAASERLPGVHFPPMTVRSPFHFEGTTILSVRRAGRVVMGGDGQVSLGNTVMKGDACKVRRMRGDQMLAGFAGGAADAFTLFERSGGMRD